MKKFRFTALLLCLAVLCCALLALAACNDSGSSGQSGSSGEEDPPAEKTVSVADVYDANVNEDGLAADITLAKQQKILSSIAGAENVNYLTDRTAIVEMADGTSHLFDITAAFSAEDKSFLENIADAIYAAANLDPDATITEAQEQATAQALKAAARQFAADAEQIIQNVSVDFVQLPQVDQSVELRENVSEFAGIEQVVFSPMTESMAFTSEGNLESENCTMSYAFGINSDGSITAFVVTYADNGETAQEKIDNLANPGAAIISEVGTFPAGVDFSSQLPQLVQAPATISADMLYNQVFGEDYNFTKLDDALAKVLKTLTEGLQTDAKILLINTDNAFDLYYDRVDSIGRRGLTQAVYNGQYLTEILNYLEIADQIKLYENFESFAKSLIEEEVEIEDMHNATEILQSLKNETDKALEAMDTIARNDFQRTTLISNTSTNINFTDFAKKFIPDGAQAVFCYVGSLSGRNMDNINFDNTGYSKQFDLRVAYYDEGSNQLVEKVMKIVVPWFTDSTDASLYASALGNTEGVDYVISNETTNIISSPILTGATSGIEKTAEVEATR